MHSEPVAAIRRSEGRPAARTERVLAIGRAFLTVTALVAIYLDPTEPARLQAVTYGVLLGYAGYSLVILAWVNSTARITPRYGQLLHGLDILWTSALTIVSQGPVSPFFLFFLFALLAAAHRWGFRETVATALVTIAVFVLQSIAAVAMPGTASWLLPGEFELNRAILRVSYVLLTGVLLGYLAEQDKHSRAELAAMAAAARQPHVTHGLGGSVMAIGRLLGSIFRPTAVAIVVRDVDTRRTVLWQLEPHPERADRVATRRSELTPDQQAVWFFDDYGRTWHVPLEPNEDGSRTVRYTVEDVWPLGRAPVHLPPFLSTRGTDITAANLGLANEWQARVYLFGLRDRGGLERRLHLLEAMADQITPGLTNVFLLRRLRARAGAAERARVARELHDGTIQALYGVEMKIEAIRRELPIRPPVDTELGEVQDLLRHETLALRELMQALRPTELDSSEQLPDVLASLVERFRRDTGLSARFVSTTDRVSVRPSVALEIVRIVQEALVNARKHSGAQNVLVRLTPTTNGYQLVVEDDGRGFGFDGRLTAHELDTRRVGPAVIKERARVAGFALVIESAPGAGSRLEVTITEDRHG